jgi:hypothetical protein
LLLGCPSVPAMQQGAGTFHGGCRVTTDMSGKCAMLPHACRCLNPSACLGGTASANTSLFISDYKTAQCSHPYQGNLCGECLLNSTACLSISGSTHALVTHAPPAHTGAANTGVTASSVHWGPLHGSSMWGVLATAQVLATACLCR